MSSPETLAVRAIAVLASRGHNASLYALRGCEELDLRYKALKHALRKARLDPKAEAATLHGDIEARAQSDGKFRARLEKAIWADFESGFGQLVTYVLANWDELETKYPKQAALTAAGERWIGDATGAWPAELRARTAAELLRTARQLHLFTNLWVLRRLARLLDPARLAAVRDFPGMSFSAVMDEEIEEIEKRRGNSSTTADAGEPLDRADAADLAGLAFSGGGIRSATFNLGVLQFLGEHGLLRAFDYLSTVSGGGYIGSWVHAWIRRAGIDHVEECLSPSRSPDPQAPRVAPIRFLRRYSNYLTPKTGLFSADTWTMATIWLRNTFLNLLVLGLALSALILAPNWLAWAAGYVDRSQITDYWWVLLLLPACVIGLNLGGFEPRLHRRWVPGWLQTERATMLLVVVPVFLAAWGAGTVVPQDLKQQARSQKRVETLQQQLAATQAQEPRQAILEQLAAAQQRLDQVGRTPENILRKSALEFTSVLALLVLIVAVLGRFDLSFFTDKPGWGARTRTALAYFRILRICLIASAVSGMLDWLWLYKVTLKSREQTPLEILTGSAPLFLVILSVGIYIYIGLLGRRLPDDRREWMARLSGWLAICCLCWVGLCGATAFGPRAVDWLVTTTRTSIAAAAGALWASITATGAYAGRATTQNAEAKMVGIPAKWIARIAPPVFVVGLLLVLSQFLERLLRMLAGPRHHGAPALYLSLGCGIAAWLLSRRVDINEFSLHEFYRNRLVRCYLGGARAGARHANPFTGFDPADDFPVSALAPSGGYSGPYAIFNTTLNVTHGEELAWQERKGEAFVFTPKFCGFDVGHGRATHARSASQPKLSYGGYRPTRDYAYPYQNGVSVGTAVGISGAAASPNMGYQTNTSLAFLMTVLDLRLGWWLGNPRRTDSWQRPGPSTGLFQLLAELTANTNDTGRYVYLSDGGHFENLGIYELVRRRCRFIVACDSEEDKDYNFGGLGNAIRKCRTDFGVDIEIDPKPIRPEPGTRRSKTHCVVGKIRYPGSAAGEWTEGTLVYIKSSLTEDEPADVFEYSLNCAAFPHESTADQWFDETHFESYRELGFHVAESGLTGLREWAELKKGGAAKAAAVSRS